MFLTWHDINDQTKSPSIKLAAVVLVCTDINHHFTAGQVGFYAAGFPCTPYSLLHSQSALLGDPAAKPMWQCIRNVKRCQPAATWLLLQCQPAIIWWYFIVTQLNCMPCLWMIWTVWFPFEFHLLNPTVSTCWIFDFRLLSLGSSRMSLESIGLWTRSWKCFKATCLSGLSASGFGSSWKSTFMISYHVATKVPCRSDGSESVTRLLIGVENGRKKPKLKTQNGACISEATPGSSYQSRPCLHITGAVWSADQCCEERFSWVCNHHGGSISIWVHPEMVSWILVTLHHRNFSSIHAWFRASVMQSSGKIFWCPRIIGGSKEALRNTSSVLLGLNNNRRSYLAFP